MRALIPVLAAFLFFSCEKDPEIYSPSQEEILLQIPDGFPEMPFPANNKFTMERWALGKKLFYDPVLSIDGTVSCGSCHHAGKAFSDDKEVSPGVLDRPGVRNTPSLANIGYHPYFLREGGVPTLEMQVLVPIQEHNEFNHNIVDIARVLQQDSSYVAMSMKAYGREPDPFVITRAIATFERTFISGNSPYDKYRYQNKPTALSSAERRGMELFFSERANCSGCHSGFNFTDYSFRNNGLDTGYTDIGRMRLTGDPADEGLFKVPVLRNIAVTAPYMHDGRIATLEAVIEHYSAGGMAHPNKSEIIRPLDLSPQEKADLIAFLRSLTDIKFLTNPAFQAEK